LKQYVLDSSAIVRFVSDEAGAQTVESVFQEGRRKTAHIAISAVNWAEARQVLTKRNGLGSARTMLDPISRGIEISPADQTHAEAAADLRSRFNGSLADAFAASLALNRRATLVTSDSEFGALSRELKILWLEGKRR
jgi:predicted nucleic acid-binding protein